MDVAWLVALIVGHGGVMADRPDKATPIAEAVAACAVRETFDPITVLSVIDQESSFDADPCSKRVSLDRVISREPVEDHPDRERLTWRRGTAHGTVLTATRIVWNVEERGDYLHIDTCPAGEVGLMQVLRSSEYARGGYPIPGTEYDASGQVDGLMRCFVGPDDHPDHDRLAVTLNGEQLPRSAFYVEEGSICLREGPPAAGTPLTFADALSPSNRDRREQMIDPRINIALGCRELADHRDAAPPRLQDPWWAWIGAYNTGTPSSDTAKAYARRILRNYARFCAFAVPTPDGDKPLRDVWDACAAVEAEVED